VNHTKVDRQINIFDNNSFRILSELNAIRSRCDSLQQLKKKRNKSLSHWSLKEDINWICVLRARFDLDSDRSRRQKAFQIARLIKKDRKLFSTTQIRIEKINFANFLHRRKILDVKSIFCRCDWNNQTIKHVIIFCSLMMIEINCSKMSILTIITSWRIRIKNSKRSLNACCNTICCNDSRWSSNFCTNFNRFFSFFYHYFFLFFLVLNNVVTHLNDFAFESSANFERFDLIFILKDLNFSCI
jgi:hypothetical protein